MKICETRGHKFYPTVRHITDWLGIVRDENVIYCSRCGNVKSLDTATPYWTTNPSWSTGTLTTTGFTGWTYLNFGSTDPSGTIL